MKEIRDAWLVLCGFGFKPARRHLLLAEDNPLDQSTVKQGLDHAGITNPLHVVRDGQKVVDYLDGVDEFSDRQRHPLPAVVFLDLNVPLLSCFGVLAWIRQRRALTATIVVVLTASEDAGALCHARSLGADSFLLTSCNGEELADQLLEMARASNWNWLEGKRFEHV